MARVVDANKLSEKITTEYCGKCGIYNGELCCSCPMGDALNYIEEAPAADFAPKAEWVSVEEKSPEESCECLAVSRNGGTYLLHYSHRHKAFNATDDDDGDEWKLSDITHWMPLPEPPRKEEEIEQRAK